MRLVANERYWNRRRGPRVREVEFRNDLDARAALELVCTTEGEVDLVTEVAPADAARVERAEHARLVTVDALRALCLGGPPATDVGQAAGWISGLLAVSVPVAIHRYRCTTTT